VGDGPPRGVCVTHHRPLPGDPPEPATPGCFTCLACRQDLRCLLAPCTRDDAGRPVSIPGLYATLSTIPGWSPTGGERLAGFGPRSPANDHIIAMRDPRSARVRPGDPHSVPGVLAGWVARVLVERPRIPPARSVGAMSVMLAEHVDFIVSRPWVVEFHLDVTALARQLRAVNEPRRGIGRCPNTITEGDSTRVCGAMLYAPVNGSDVIECWAVQCQRKWTRRQWLSLSDQLNT
jgi:hypothetical protein